mgnify:CR=1 FL=1
MPLRRPQCLLPSIDKQVTHQHEDHRSVIPYCVSPTWAPMVMAAIRIKILHCAIAIACCRCHNCNRSIVIAAPPSPPPLSRVVLSSPILFKYRHRSQRGRCTGGGGADGLEDNKVSDNLYYFSILPKININVLFSSSYYLPPPISTISFP